MSKTLEQRIMRLEAENKELRTLWIETESDVISLRVELDERLESKSDSTRKGLARLKSFINRGKS